MTIGHTPRQLAPPTIDDIRAARARMAGTVVRTPLVRLPVDSARPIYLKLETLQPIGSFKLRGAVNAIRQLAAERLADGVYTASAGNMAQGVAWGARALGVACTVLMPESAPRTKIDAVTRLGARIELLPYDAWWSVLIDHGREGMRGAFIHPVSDTAVMAGNGTIGLEIFEDVPDASAVLVPFGGGGLVSGIASALRALAPAMRIYGCEVDTAAPLTAALAAGGPVMIERRPSFVDGIGGRGVLDEMWPIVAPLIDGAVVAPLAAVETAVRCLVERARIVAEGAGATPVAVAMSDDIAARLASDAAGSGPIVCVVSGGNIDTTVLAALLAAPPS